jgi:uncharacterized damage-inducible protein DinB
MFEHAESSRRRILAAAEKMDAATFAARQPGMFSVRDVLAHLMDCEDFWVGSVTLGEKQRKFTPEKYSDATALGADWEEVRERTRRLFATLTVELLRQARTVPGEGGETFRVETILWHFLTHEIHHRGQACMLMRERGFEPPDVDLL